MYIIIIGCGRLGSTLARELSDNGHDVCILDRDNEKLSVLGSGFNGQKIAGIEFDNDKLLEAGIHKADVLLAVTNDDNINITVSLIAKDIHKVPKIIARVNSPEKSYIYEKLGIETINPVLSGIDVLKNKLLTDNIDIISVLSNDIEIIELLVNRSVTLSVLEIEATCSCIISGLLRKNIISLPEKKEVIRTGDRIICTIQKDEKKKLISLVSKEIYI
jgi:trk system potassium uptake protein TrkA